MEASAPLYPGKELPVHFGWAPELFRTLQRTESVAMLPAMPQFNLLAFFGRGAESLSGWK